MRVLVITQYFWPENFIINDMVKGLREKGHEVEVLTGKPNYPEGKIYEGYSLFGRSKDDYDGIPVRRVPLIPRGRSKSWNLVLNYFSFVITASSYAALFARNRFDRIFVFQPSPLTSVIPALVVKRLFGTPVILLIQDLWPESLSATGAVTSQRILGYLEKAVSFLLDRVDIILVQSQAFIPKLIKKGVSDSKIHYFPDYADDVFTVEAAGNTQNRLAAVPEGFRILFAGNIGESQDFETILNAAERLKDNQDIHWVIVGDGRKRKWVETQVRTRGLQRTVHLLGKFPLEDMPSFYSSADALLVTLKDEEIFGLTIPGKIQPYMAFAKPILAALNGEGGRIILEANAGYVAPSGDYEQLASYVLELKGLPKSRLDEMGKSGNRYYEKNFSRRVLLEKLDSFVRI